MTDKKNPQNEAVDWAERLKASMNDTPVDTPARSSMREDDELAALLRAQLAHREQATATAAFELDTSEFEEARSRLGRGYLYHS